MGYKTIYTLDELKAHISGVSIVAFDFETAPDRHNSPSAFVSGQETPEKLTSQAVVPLSQNVHSVGTFREPCDYRRDPRAALDAHKSHIVGISFAVNEGDAAYLPLAHTVGENAPDPAAIWDWLKVDFFENPAVVKVAHNLAFEAAFLYARGIIIQEPC